MEKNDIAELIELVHNTSVTKVNIKNKDIEIKIEKQTLVAAPPAIHRSEQVVLPGSSPTPAQPVEEPKTEAEGHYITSPLVGTFYQSPSPDTAPFVSVGDHISKGDTVCIIEAMKLMNEVKSEISGRLVSIEVKNASAVEFGSRLMRIIPD